MTEPERDESKEKLDALCKRLDADVCDLKERGELSVVHRPLVQDITRRQAELQRKVALAQANGTTWDIIKRETERDFSSLFDDLLQINEQLDASEMRQFFAEDHRRRGVMSTRSDLTNDLQKLNEDAVGLADENARLRRINAQMLGALRYALPLLRDALPVTVNFDWTKEAVTKVEDAIAEAECDS